MATGIGVGFVLLSAALCTLSRRLEFDTHKAQAVVAETRAGDPDRSRSSLTEDIRRAERRDRRQRLDIFHRLEWMTYDWRMRRLARSTRPTPDLGLVLADNRTVEELAAGIAVPGENWDLFWPRWPVYGRLLRELRAQGARAVAFDILLTDRRYSEDQLVRMGPDGEPEAYSSDHEFARELRSAGAPAFLALEPDAIPTPVFHRACAEVGDVSSPKDADGVARRIRAFTDFRWINPEVGEYAERWGLTMVPDDGALRVEDPRSGTTTVFQPDAEGLISLPFRWDQPGLPVRRRIALHQNHRVWHLGIVLAAHHLGLDLDSARRDALGIELTGTNGLRRHLPVDAHGYLPVRWDLQVNQISRFPQANLASLLQEAVARGTNPPPADSPWRDRLVVVGSTASGNNLADRGATPLDNSDFLVTTYLNVARMVIDEEFIDRIPSRAEILMVMCLAALSVTAAWQLKTHISPWIIGAGAGAWLILSALLFESLRIWLPVAHPIVSGMLLPFAGMVTCRAFFEQREQQRIRGIFSRLVSPEIVHEVLESRHVSLGGARREITVLFADIRGFTALTDRRQVAAEEEVRRRGLDGAAADAHFEGEARQVLDTVNEYLAAIADVVKQHQGTLDKYIGDCVMAFWGAPTANAAHAVQAVRAGIGIQQAVARLNERRISEATRNGQETTPLDVGTGINTGLVTVGLMGSEAHVVNYTAFGREVNLASRLEGVAGHSRIVIGINTHSHLVREAPELARRCLALPPVRVKGFQQPVPVFEVDWKASPDTRPSDPR